MEEKETNEKLYYNRNLDKILSKYIDRSQYGDFAIILKDIFQRRAYEFDFSETHMEMEVANFIQRVKTVEFVPSGEMRIAGAMGVFIPNEATIRLNQNFFSNLERNKSEMEFGSAMYETLTHEVYHGISAYDGRTGLKYYSPAENCCVGTALNEIFTETAANRASIPRGTKEAEQYRADTDGYADITFVTNLLAASVGLSEKELLRAGIQNRGELMQLISSKFPAKGSFDHASKLFEKIENSLDLVYNIRYSQKGNQTPDEKDAEAQLLETSLKTLYGTSFELASYQIENDNKEITPETVADAQYRYLKMSKIMEDSLDSLNKYNAVSLDSIKNIYQGTLDIRNGLAERVVGMNTYVKEGYKITNPRDLNRIAKLAKNGHIRSATIPLQEMYGVNIAENTIMEVHSITQDLEYERRVMQEDFDNGKRWENKDVAIVIKRVFDKDMERKIALENEKTEEIPVVDDKTEELPVVDDDKTEELPVVDENKKNFFGKLRNTISNIVVRLKNINQPKLDEGTHLRENDNSEYFANLVNGFSRNELENTLDQYKVEVDISKINKVHQQDAEEKIKEQEDEGRE